MLDVQSKCDVLINELVDKGYAVLDDFLDETDFLALKTYAQRLSVQDEFKKAHIGQGRATHELPSIRSDRILWLNNRSEEPALQAYLEQMCQFKTLLNQSLFLGLEDFEAHFAHYPPQTYYKKHVDQFIHNKDRRISCVFYLNEDWQLDDGGQLVLYAGDDEILTSILPLRNRLACFRSDMLHEVYQTQRARLSITAWFKVRPML